MNLAEKRGCRILVLVFSLLPAMAGALTPSAGSTAPLPDGVSPSHKLVPGMYVRSEGTLMATGGIDLQIQMFKAFDKICQARGLGGAKVVQGRIEDLALPSTSQAYFDGMRSAGYAVALFLEPNVDDPNRCSYRVVAETTRVLKVFDGHQTTLTVTDRKGTHTRVIPGDMRPPAIEKLAGQSWPPASGWQKGSADLVAGVPCHHWTFDAAGAKIELCIPDPGAVAPPMDRGSLRSHFGKGDVTLYDETVKELTTSSSIDEAVFDPAAWGAGR